MKKLLKSILIATASIGAVAGSTTAVVSCWGRSGQEVKDSQKEYDDALKSLLSKLTNTPIVMDIAHNESLDNVKSQIQTIIKNNYIANDTSLSSALGDAEVLVPQNAFDLTNINTNVVQATGITFQVEPKVAGLTKGAAQGLNIGYKVINNDQDNYVSIMNKIGTHFQIPGNFIFDIPKNAMSISQIATNVYNFIHTSGTLTPEETKALKPNYSVSDVIATLIGNWNFSLPADGVTSSGNTISLDIALADGSVGGRIQLPNGVHYRIRAA